MLDSDVRIFYIFKALYETGNASHVAQLYSISPSKVSRYIAQLRDLHMDSLFIRKKTHFIPTKKAEQLYPQVCEIIEKINAITMPQANEDKVRDCIIAMPATLTVGLPEYLNNLIKEANAKINLSVISSHREICKKIINGSICIAVTNRHCHQVCQPKDTHLLGLEPIGDGEFVYVVSHKDNPMWQEELILDNIAKYPFVVTQVPGFNDELDPFEVYCQHRGMTLNIPLRTQTLASTLETIISHQAVTFIGPQSAIEFLSKFSLLRIEKLAGDEYQKLHEKMNKPIYSLLYLASKKEMLPQIIVDGIQAFISNSVTEQNAKIKLENI